MTVLRTLRHGALVVALIFVMSGAVYAQAPTVTSVDPSSGPSSGGTIVTINGSNFTGTTEVNFGGEVTTDFIVLDSSKIRAATPPHVSGSVDVSVTNTSGTGTLSNGYEYRGVPTVRDDSYQTPANVPLTVAPPGVLANDDTNGGGPMTVSPWNAPSNGGLVLQSDGSFTYTANPGFSGTDSFSYRASNVNGQSNIATVTITVTVPEGAGVPGALSVWLINGNTVTLRWTAPVGGLTPTRYSIECGASPGQVLQTMLTPDATTVFTFTAPSGSFYCRVHTLAGSDRSAASNEIRIFVATTAVAPSPPSSLAALVNGNTLALSWRNTFSGGTATSLVLDVTGSVAASLPVSLSESFTFTGVPAGTYSLSLRAVNAAGSSAGSNIVTVTFPGPCSGAPATPANFLAYRVGNTIFVIWDAAPAASPAATGYVLNVSGSFVGALPTTRRLVSGTVPAGAYNFSVVATNSCGSSGATPGQTVVIP
jgi:hypothetical protein